jgi:hypothetical protein
MLKEKKKERKVVGIETTALIFNVVNISSSLFEYKAKVGWKYLKAACLQIRPDFHKKKIKMY